MPSRTPDRDVTGGASAPPVASFQKGFDVRKFKPPKLSDPPDVVIITWVDAQGDIETDGPAEQAGGLVELPRVGFFVRHARSGPHGPFVVIAAEWCYAKDGSIHVRDTTSIPVGWITSWAVLRQSE